MPTALTQPPQFGWQATQLNRIGNLRSSREVPAVAEPPGAATTPGKATQMAAAPSNAQPRTLSDLKSLNSVPSPASPPRGAVAMAPTPIDSVTSVL